MPDVSESVAIAIADKVNRAIVCPHGPGVDTIEIGELSKSFCRYIHHHNVALIRTAVILAPVDLRFLVVSQPFTIRRIGGLHAHVSSGFPRHPTFGTDEI